jgi:hypothetical protein
MYPAEDQDRLAGDGYAEVLEQHNPSDREVPIVVERLSRLRSTPTGAQDRYRSPMLAWRVVPPLLASRPQYPTRKATRPALTERQR